MPLPDIAVLREKVWRRSFLVGQQTKFKIKIRSTLTYEGVKLPGKYGLFTRNGREWLRDLGLEPVDSYLRMMEPLQDEIRLLSLELRHIAADDEDVLLLMTIPGVGYYIALLVKAEIGDISRFHTGDQLASYAGLARPPTEAEESPTTAASPRRGQGGSGGRWWRLLMFTSGLTRR